MAIFLGIALGLTGVAPVEVRLPLLLAIAGISYILSAWVLFEDLKGIEWVTLMVLPVGFTLGAGVFANFLPTAVPSFFGMEFQIETSLLLARLFKMLYWLFYVFGMYAVLLVENIFSVASIRNIQLTRAARSTGFILTLVTGLFFYTVGLSLKIHYLWIMIITFIVTLALSYSNYWTIDLKNEYSKLVKRFTISTAWVLMLLSGVLAFWPVKPFMGGLMITAGLYSILGLLEQRLRNRVFIESVYEYIFFSLIIVLVGYLTTSWRGA